MVTKSTSVGAPILELRIGDPGPSEAFLPVEWRIDLIRPAVGDEGVFLRMLRMRGELRIAAAGGSFTIVLELALRERRPGFELSGIVEGEEECIK